MHLRVPLSVQICMLLARFNALPHVLATAKKAPLARAARKGVRRPLTFSARLSEPAKIMEAKKVSTLPALTPGLSPGHSGEIPEIFPEHALEKVIFWRSEIPEQFRIFLF